MALTKELMRELAPEARAHRVTDEERAYQYARDEAAWGLYQARQRDHVMHVENCLDFDDATYDRIILEGHRPSYLNSDCMGFFMRSEDSYD